MVEGTLHVYRVPAPTLNGNKMSGNSDWKSRGDYRGSWPDGFALLIKPFRFSQLLQLVKSEQS